MNRRNSKCTRLRFGNGFPAGTSLVETVLVIAVSSVLTGIVVTGLGSLMQYDHRQAENTINREQLHMLFAMVRDDAHHAIAYQLDVGNQSLHFSQPGQQNVEYRFHEGECNRIQSSPASGEQTRRLRIPADLELSSDTLEGKQGELLRIKFETQTTELTLENKRFTSNWQLELVAQVGSDLARQSP